jgi:hypothetical protein
MPWLRAVFLLAVLAVTPGYRFRCYWACMDQTAIQNDYVEQRDRCREYAQLKLDMAMRSVEGPVTEDKRKTQLVALFSECMANNGWTVPSGKDEADKAAGAAAPLAAGAAAGAVAANPQSLGGQAPAPPPQQQKAFLSRNSECAFARHSASVSAIAKARAEACDLECDERLKAAPEGPRPAACPSEDAAPELSRGSERE